MVSLRTFFIPASEAPWDMPVPATATERKRTDSTGHGILFFPVSFAVASYPQASEHSFFTSRGLVPTGMLPMNTVRASRS